MPKQEIIDKNRIAQNIKQLRKNYGETQEQLAQAIGVTKSAISNYESGNRSDTETLARIAEHYLVPFDQLVFGEICPLSLKAQSWGEMRGAFVKIFARPVTPEDRADERYMRAHERYRMILKGKISVSDNLDIMEELIELYDKGHSEAGISLLILFLLQLITLTHVGQDLEYLDSLSDEELKEKRDDCSPTGVIRTFWLAHFPDDIAANDPEYEALLRKEKESVRESRREMAQNIREGMEMLRDRDPDWMAFFEALATFFNLWGDEEEARDSEKIGLGMIISLAKSENVFAKRFLRVAHEL